MQAKMGPCLIIWQQRTRLRVDVKKGQLITTDMVIPPEESTLWKLRRQMEADNPDTVSSQ